MDKSSPRKPQKRRISSFGRIGLQLDKIEKTGTEDIESPAIIMTIGEELDYDEVLERIKKVIQRSQNFKLRSKVVGRGGRNENYEEIPEFAEKHLRKNVKVLDLEGCDEEMMLEKLSEIMNTGFDRNLPLFEFYITRNYPEQLLVFKVNHAIGDGLSLGQTFMGMFDEEEEYLSNMKKKYAFALKWTFRFRYYIYIILMFLPTMLYIFVTLCLKPLWQHVIKPCKWAQKRAWKRALAPGDVKFYSEELTRKRKLGVVRGIRTKTFKRIAKKLRLTVNELFMVMISEALSKVYPSFKGADFTIKMALPISTRMTWNVGDLAWSDRVNKVKWYSKMMKTFPLHFYSYILACRLSNFFPLSWSSSIYKFTLKYQTFLSSNIASPQFPCHINGKSVVGIMPIIPLNLCSLFSCGLITYDDVVTICFNFDTAFKDTNLMLRAMEEKYSQLEKTLLL